MEPGIDPEHPLAGFTLIELVAVVAVLAVLATGATLALGRPVAGPESDLSRFRAAYEQNRSLAVHGGVRRGLLLAAQGSRQMRWRAGGWQASGAQQPWRGDVLYLPDGARAAAAAANLVFLPNGQTTAFAISFGGAGCRSDGWTGLVCRGDPG